MERIKIVAGGVMMSFLDGNPYGKTWDYVCFVSNRFIRATYVKS